MCISTPVEFLTLILFKMNTPLLRFLKGNIRDFSMKNFVTEDEIFHEHLTYLKVCHVIIKTYICSEEQDKEYTLLA